MKYQIVTRTKDQVSVVLADSGDVLFTGAIEVAQSFIFFNSYVRGLKVHSKEYERANSQAKANWELEKEAFCFYAQVGVIVER